MLIMEVVLLILLPAQIRAVLYLISIVKHVHSLLRLEQLIWLLIQHMDRSGFIHLEFIARQELHLSEQRGFLLVAQEHIYSESMARLQLWLIQ